MGIPHRRVESHRDAAGEPLGGMDARRRVSISRPGGAVETRRYDGALPPTLGFELLNELGADGWELVEQHRRAQHGRGGPGLSDRWSADRLYADLQAAG